MLTWNATRSQIGALMRELRDVRGNRDGLVSNEDAPAGTLPSFAQRQPILARWSAALSVGLSASDEKQALETFVADAEARWKDSVSTLKSQDGVFRADKALTLDRLGRTPSEVVDDFVHASGSVDGHPIDAREVFVQRWKPTTTPTGKVVVLCPGYLETGRNFYEQVQLFNRQGADVIVMDAQWAGYTMSPVGKIDRGFGVTRDIAAVAAYAAQLADREYASLPGKQVILSGNSMGAGPGAIGALTMNDNGLIQLDGAQMPKGLSALVESPYFATTRGIINAVLVAGSYVPLLRMIPLPAIGLPRLSVDKTVNSKIAHRSTVERIKARLQALRASAADLERIRGLISTGHGPLGRVYIVQGEGDLLADTQATQEVAAQMGPKSQLVVLPTDSHVLEEDPSYQERLLDGLAWVSTP